MKGWKTWAGGGALIFTGIGIFFDCVVSGNYTELNEAIPMIGLGLATFGIGHKVEKAGG